MHGLRYGMPVPDRRKDEAGFLSISQDDVFAPDIHRALQRAVDRGGAHAVSIYPVALRT